MKVCSGCETEKPRTEFYARRRSSDGLQARCKACNRSTAREWHRRQHPEWARPWTPERDREWRAARRAANPERYREISRLAKQRQRERDPGRAAALARARRARDPAAARSADTARRARRLRAPRLEFTAAQLAAKRAYWGNRCWLCGGPDEALDHVKPLSKGGPHMLANLRPACTVCNTRKGARWPLAEVA